MKQSLLLKVTLFLACLLLLLSLVGCWIPLRALFLGYPDAKDAQRFPSQEIKAGDNPFLFQYSKENWGQRIRFNDWMTDLPVFKTIEEAVRDHQTQACLVIRRDTILYEYYAKGKDEKSLHTSYSIAKSIISALVGFAIQDGFIKNEEELVTEYLPELAGKIHSDQLTIRYLLNMTSGLKKTLELDAKLYYGRDILKSLKSLDFERPPGTLQTYLNINAQLLGIILERATQKSPAQYLQEKIWRPLGMESNAFWSTDEKGLTIKTFCCLNATAKDYARFGRLFMQGGKWKDQQLLDAAWVARSLARDTTAGSSHGYNYNWHIGLKGYTDFMAIGLYKQHLYMNPDKELIVVVLNNREDKLKAERTNWPYIMRQIADHF